MNRSITVILIGALLTGCYCQCRKTVSAQHNTQTQSQEIIISEPIAQNTDEVITEQIVPNTTEQTTFVKGQVTSNPIGKVSKTRQPVVAVTPVADKSDLFVEQETEKYPLTAAAPFQPTFKGEEAIDTANRRLHPYAALAPDASAKQTAPWAYEQLKYGIYYSFIKAGTAYIHNLGLVNIDGRPAYVFQTTAFSASVIDAVFKVRDINQSWLDATDFYSYGYGQSVREGNYVRDEWLKFNYPAKKYEGLLQKKEEPSEISGPLDMKVVDMLTSLYFVRTHQLNVGEDVVFDIVNREKQYPLIVKVLKKEKVKTAAGKFDCILVEPQIRGEGIFIAKGKSLKVWLTDDEYKMPVKMKVEVFIGSVSAELLEYQRQAPANIL